MDCDEEGNKTTTTKYIASDKIYIRTVRMLREESFPVASDFPVPTGLIHFRSIYIYIYMQFGRMKLKLKKKSKERGNKGSTVTERDNKITCEQ